MKFKTYQSIIESLLFVSGDGLSLKEISTILELDERTTRNLIYEMRVEYEEQHRGLGIIEFNDCFQLSTRSEYFEYVEKLVHPRGKQALSAASLETLSIIAYKQPITKNEIDSVRGVHSESSIARLSERGLICETARLDAPGRPILYGTTDTFLKMFGLKHISELPSLNDAADLTEIARSMENKQNR